MNCNWCKLYASGQDPQFDINFARAVHFDFGRMRLWLGPDPLSFSNPGFVESARIDSVYPVGTSVKLVCNSLQGDNGGLALHFADFF